MIASFLGGLALFLYGQFLLEHDLQKTSRAYLHGLIKLLTKYRISAILVGGALAIGMQSSTIPVFGLIGLINIGVLQLGQAMGVVLGASIGTTLTIQAISFNVAGYSLWFIIVGFLLSKASKYAKGELLMGLGLMFFGINLIGKGVLGFKEVSFGISFLEGMATSPIRNIIGAFILTIISQSTLAAIAVGIALMREGGLGISCAIPIILGAHLGAGVLPLIYSWKVSKTTIGIQLGAGNLIYRVIGVLIFIPLMESLARISLLVTQWMGARPVRQIANAHTLFTVATVGLFVPFIVPYARFIKRIIPEKKISIKDLELKQPRQIILNVIEEKKIKLAEDVYKILNDSIRLWEEDSFRFVDKIGHGCFSIRLLEDDLLRYIAGLPKDFFNETQCARQLEIANNLEKISNIIGSGLVDLTKKRIAHGLSFSIEGLNEILSIHKCIINEFGMLVEILKGKKIKVEEKEIDSLISASFEAHINRMYKGFQETKGTVSLHADALTLLENIHWHIQKIMTKL